MRLEKLVYTEYLHGKQFPVGTVILRLDNKTELAISNFYFQNGKLEVFCYKPYGSKQYGNRQNRNQTEFVHQDYQEQY